MDDMIREFYESEIATDSRKLKPESEEYRLTCLIADKEEALRETLTAAQKEMMEEFEETETEMQGLVQYNRYRRGFLDGAKLMMNIFLSECLPGADGDTGDTSNL